MLLKRLGIKCDIIVFTKCWLSYVTAIPKINGYKTFSTTANPIQNDGVVIYISVEINYNVEEPNMQNCNGLLIKSGNKDVALLVVYRSPSYTNLDPFLASLDETLQKISNFKKSC